MKNNETYQRTIFDAMPDAMLISNEQGVITQVNRQAECLLGYAMNELLGLAIEDLVPERYRAAHPALRAKFAASAITRPMGAGRAVKALRKDGSELDVEISLSPIQTEQGLFFASAMRDITERKQAEARLRSSEARFRRMANSTPVMIWIADAVGNPLFVNQSWLQFTGIHSLEAVTPESWLNTIHPDDRAATFAAYYQNTHKYQTITTEYRLRNATGDWCWVLDKGMPLHDENGVFCGYIGSAIDITERKQAQQLLQDKERMLSESQRIAHIGSWSADLATGRVSCSDELYRIYAMPPQALGYSTQEFLEVIHPDDRKAAKIWLSDCLAEKPPRELDFRIRLADGSVRFVRSNGGLQYDDSHRPLRIVGTAQDITECKQMEDALRTSEYKFRSIIDILPVAMSLNDANQNIIFANQSFIKSFGYDLSEIPTLPSWWQKVYPNPDQRYLAQNAWQALDENKAFTQQERVIHCKDGSQKTVLVSVTTFDDVHLAVLYDITERKQTEIALRESEARYRAVAQSANDAIIIIDSFGNIVSWNRGAEVVFGYTETEIKGQQITLLMPEKYRGLSLAAINRIMSGGEPRIIGKTVEFEGQRKDKSEFPLELSLSQWQTPDGWFFSGIIRDISERKQANRVLNQLKAMIDISSDGFWIADAQGHLLQVNAAYAKMSGYTTAELLTLHISQLDAVENPAQVKFHIEKIIAQGYDQFETRHRHKDGHAIDVEISAAFLAEFQQFCVFCRDISERKRIELDLHIAAIAFQSQEPIVITNTENVILRINKAFTETTGYTQEDALGQKISLLRSGRHDAAFYAAMWESVLTTGSWQGEIWDRRKNGEIYPKWLVITAVKGNDGIITHYVGTHTDITERKMAENQIKQLAFYDPLTELPNRRLLQERLKHSIDVERRDGKQLALLMLDLDRFKAVNDNLGHLAGDELLQQVAQRITTRLRDIDMVARLGGDEFVVLLEDIAHPDDAARVAEKLVTALSQPFTLTQSDNVRIGVSIGISLYPQHGDNPAQLMDYADAALYQAKDAGRGHFAYFSQELTLATRERIALETRLRRAIVQQELRVFFQPQMDIASGRIVGAEALVRWQDPEYGLVLPSRFIAIAEETGLIMEIGSWVLRETCKQGRQWLNAGLPPITLAVNVSPQQFRRGDICMLVAEVLAETDFPANQLELEITESGLMENQANAAGILNCLRAQGIRLAIDDFGTGYSSLAYLKHFPLDVLKIDKSFIEEIPFQQGDMEIAATIIAMGHILGFKVLAEGVETAEQLAFLQEKGCDSYQGYFKSKAVPAVEFAELLI